VNTLVLAYSQHFSRWEIDYEQLGPNG
jgi:hypothetical protein